MTENCIFCAIAQKRKKEDIVYEDDSFVAFRDINPSAPVHLLIIPKEHLGLVGGDLEKRSEIMGKIFPLSRKIAKKMGVSGSYKLATNAGYSATETPDHLHIHLIGGWKSPAEVHRV